MYPFANHKGQFDRGYGQGTCTVVEGRSPYLTEPIGEQPTSSDPVTGQRSDEGPMTVCMEIDWPGRMSFSSGYRRPMWGTVSPWMGSLVYHGRDLSGQMYRRNRFYDPKTARFTQEDPIGIAGGLNVYGYADGDPVSYSDPYGLFRCPGRPGCPAPGTHPTGSQFGGPGWLDRRLAGAREAVQEAINNSAPVQAVGAVADFVGNYRQLRATTREHNLLGADKYFHCTANCDAAQRGSVGSWVAERLSNVREIWDQRVKGYPRDDSLEDQQANSHGRTGGRANPERPCEAVCSTYRPRGLPE